MTRAEQRLPRVPLAGQSPFDAPRRRRGGGSPRLRPDVVAVVFLGGCVGGYARYAVSDAWPTPPAGFPWPVFGVNLAGAFVLGLVVVVATELAPSRYLRPLVGTGFCGALTTFSSVVVAADRLLAHGQVAIGLAYLLGSIGGGLGAALLGVATGQALSAVRRRQREEGSE